MSNEENKKISIFWFILLIALACILGALPTFCLSAEGDNDFMGGFAPPALQVPPQTPVPQAPLPSAPSIQAAAISSPLPPKPDTSAAPAEFAPPSFSTAPLPPAPATLPNSFGTAPKPTSISSVPPVKPAINNAPAVSATAQPSTLPFNTDTQNNDTKKRREFRRSDIIPAVAEMEPSPELLKNQPELLRSVADEQHPFRYYYEIPKQPQSLISGKPLSVAEICEAVSLPAARCRLLEKYWELAGLLIEYNVRLDAELMCQKWLNEAAADAQRRSVFSLALNQTQQQRKSAELTFIKTQWLFAEMLKPYRQNITERDNLPLPCDFPVYKKYETYSDKIAHSERAVLLGHLIPVQEQLLNSKKEESRAADAMIQNMIQQLPQNPRDLIFTLNQRTEAFCGLIAAAVDYNNMIAGYVSETVGSGVSKYRLVSAVIELPKWNRNAVNQK